MIVAPKTKIALEIYRGMDLFFHTEKKENYNLPLSLA